MMPDFTQEIYEILDRCGLTASEILTSRQSTPKTVSEIRRKIAKEIKQLIDEKIKQAVDTSE